MLNYATLQVAVKQPELLNMNKKVRNMVEKENKCLLLQLN